MDEPVVIKITGAKVYVSQRTGSIVIEAMGGTVEFCSGVITLMRVDKDAKCGNLVKDDQGPTPSSSC